MPGLDLAVVDALGLRNIRQRICVDNTGCYGSFSALTVAQAFCAAEPDAVVLVTCTEVRLYCAHNALLCIIIRRDSILLLPLLCF